MYTRYNSLKSICKLAPKPVMVTVLRNNERKNISSADLVPGDVVVFTKADYTDMKKKIAAQKPKQVGFSPVN